MRQPSRTIRSVLCFTTSLSLFMPFLPATALAQDDSAPPSRVGQIAYVSGQVSFNGSGTGGWAAAALNYPVAEGDSLYTQDGAQAAIALNASKISLNSDTELQINQLTDTTLAATQSQGEAYFAINYLEPGQNFTITTPRGAVTISQNGQYDVIAGDASNPTVVTTLRGAASVTAPGVAVEVEPGQEAVLSGDQQTTAQLGQAQPDDFARQMLAVNTAPPPSYAPPIVGQMTGAYELSRYGNWDQSPQYGAVWYPQVAPGWAPYREGHWANIEPWGWTWVENEPWGFAPFHYGRWIDEGGRWGWVPAGAYQQGGDYGPSYQPVYAPAVVTFFGLGLAAGITAAVLASGSVGWVPLGPNEAFHPYYRCPPDYVRRINIVNIRNVTIINEHNNYNYDHFANRRGATFIPASAMSRGEQVAHFNHAPPPAELATARPITPGAREHLPPAARPLAQQRPGFAPHPSDFAQRHDIPPATMSHAPINQPPGQHAPMQNAPGQHAPMQNAPGQHAPEHGMPGQNAPRQPGFNGGTAPQAQPQHPGFSGNNPGFHPPPAPPGAAEHPQNLPRQGQPQNFHPQQPGQPQARPAMPEVIRPSAPAEQFHPQEQPRPGAAPAMHQPAPQPQFQGQPAMQRPPQMQAQPQMQRPPEMQMQHQPAMQRPPQMQAQPQMQRPPEMQRPAPQPAPRPEPPHEAPHPQPQPNQTDAHQRP